MASGRTLATADWVALAAYVGMLIAIAAYHSRRLKAQDDLYLAGRSMSRLPIAISMYVAIFSTNSLLGVIGWVNRGDGSVWIGLQNIGIIMAVPLVVALYPDIFFRLRITTAYEYLERRFDYRLRAVAGLFFICARVMWLATILYGGSLVISQMLGRPGAQVSAIALLALLGLLLALAGGMRSVIWTDVAQFFVLFGSVVLMGVLAILRCGGIGQVISTAAATGRFTTPPLFSVSDDLSVTSGLCLGLVGMLSSAGTDQVLLQTYLTAKNVNEARASLWFNGFVLKPLSLIFPLLGMIIFVYFQSHPAARADMRTADDALPVFIMRVLPAGARGLAIAGIMSAMLTTFQSGITALSACIQVDYLGRWRERPLSASGAVRLGRGLMIAWSGVLVTAALFVLRLGRQNSIIQILNILMYPFSGVLLGIFLLGLLTNRATPGATLGGAAAGFAITAFIPLAQLPVSNFYYGAIATIATFAVGYAASPRRAAIEFQKEIEDLTHAVL